MNKISRNIWIFRSKLMGLKKLQGHQHTENAERNQKRVDRCLHLPIFFCPQILACKDRSTHSAADRHHDEHCRKGIRRPYGRQRVLPHKISDDHRVRHVIELLKQISNDHRQRKKQHGAPRLPIDQIQLHLIFPFPDSFLYIQPII